MVSLGFHFPLSWKVERKKLKQKKNEHDLRKKRNEISVNIQWLRKDMDSLLHISIFLNIRKNHICTNLEIYI